MPTFQELASEFNQAGQNTPAAGGNRPANIEAFVAQATPVAELVGKRLGVDPAILLGQWGLETGWGRSVIPGTNNLGNIKDFSGRGVAATDNMTGSRDGYRAYASFDEFGDDYAGLLERRYRGATGAGGDAIQFGEALKAGGYAEDPDYVTKLARATEMVRGNGAAAGGARRARLTEPEDFLAAGAPIMERAARQASADESPISTSFGRGWEGLKHNAGLMLDNAVGDASGVAERIQFKRAWDEKNPAPSSSQAFMERFQQLDDDDFMGVLAAAVQNPTGALNQMVEQTPNSLPGLALQIPTAIASGALFATVWGAPLAIALQGAAAFVGNVLPEGGAFIEEEFAKSGIDPSNVDAVTQWAVEHRGELLQGGATKAGVISVVDGVAGYLGGKLIAGPAARFSHLDRQFLRQAGINPADAGAVAAVRGSAAYKQAMAPVARELVAATAGAQKVARALGSVGLESIGEGAGEFAGTYAATGEASLKEATLEGLMGGGTSVAMTGANAAISRLQGPDATRTQLEALAATPPAPVIQPNSPLGNAAEIVAANTPPAMPGADPAVMDGAEGGADAAMAEQDPFAERVARVASFAEDKTFIQAMRSVEGYGPESVSEMLSAFVKARNPNIDPLVRERALTELEQFLDAFARRPNFTLGGVQPEAGTGTQVATTEQPGQATPDAPRLEAPAFAEKDITPRPAAPSAMLETEQALQAKRNADAAYEQAYQDLVKAEQLGAADADILAYQQAIDEARAQQVEMDGRLQAIREQLDSSRAQRTTEMRRAVLDAVLADPETANPRERFAAELNRQGFRDSSPTADELAAIERFESVRAAVAAPAEIEPSAPNELDPYQSAGSSVPTVKIAPGAGLMQPGPLDLIAQGWMLNGKTLQHPTSGKRRILNARELDAVRAAKGQGNAQNEQAVQADRADRDQEQSRVDGAGAQAGVAPVAEQAGALAQDPAQDVQPDAAQDGQAGAPAGVVAERPMPSRDDPLFAKKNLLRQLQNTVDAGTHPSGRPFMADEIASWSRSIDELRAEIAEAEQASKAPADPGAAALRDAVAQAESATHTAPTDGQKEAGNYAKGKVDLHGQRISIETPKGAERSGVGTDGKRWSVTMPASYGYFLGTMANDGDHVDVFVGPKPESGLFWVVNQVKPDSTTYDEPKVMLGYESAQAAQADYLLSFSGNFGGRVFGEMVGPFSVAELGKMLPTMRRAAPVKGEVAADGLMQRIPAIDADRAKAAAMHENATAPEHVKNDGDAGVTVEELKQIAKAFREHIDNGGDAEVTHVFDAPEKGDIVNLEKKAGITAANQNGKRVYHRDAGWLSIAEAKAEIEKWKENARKQGETNANSDKVVLSLFDLSGEWSKPWEEAGYQVFRFDIQDDPVVGDVNNFSTEFFNDWFGDFDGMDIYAILAATPCTDFAVSGSRHFAAKDADGRTVSSVRLVKQTLNAIEYFKPAVWALENPVGRIESLTGLPPWRLSFDPYHLGDTYTKKTLIWGRFNGDLPVAPVEPVEGSKMHSQYGGKSQATKNARSVTPEGFAYSFFQANNALDNPAMALANKFDRLDRKLIGQAIDAGVTPEQIERAVEDFYYMELDDDAANAAIRALLPAPTSGPDATVEKGAPVQMRLDIPEPAGWRSSWGKASKYAEALGIALRGDDGKYLKLPALTAAIEAKKNGQPAVQAESAPAEDLSAMFDAALDEAFGEPAAVAHKPAEKEPKAEPSEVVKKYAASLRIIAGGPDGTPHIVRDPADKGGQGTTLASFELGANGRPVKVKHYYDHTRAYATLAIEQWFAANRPAAPARAPAKSAGSAAASAATNAAMGLADVAKGLNALFKPKPGTLGMGVPFNEDTYAAAKPYFEAGIAHFKQAGADVADMMKSLVASLRDQFGMDRDTIAAMKPYVLRFMKERGAGARSDKSAEVYEYDGIVPGFPSVLYKLGGKWHREARGRLEPVGGAAGDAKLLDFIDRYPKEWIQNGTVGVSPGGVLAHAGKGAIIDVEAKDLGAGELGYDGNVSSTQGARNGQDANDRGDESALAPVSPGELQGAEGREPAGPRSGSVRGSDADGDGGAAEDARDYADGSLAGEPRAVLPEGSDQRVEEVEIAGEARPLDAVAESVKHDAPASEPKPKFPPRFGDNPGNYAITDADALGTGTTGERIRANMAAVRLVLELEGENRYPTRDEQAVLAKYVGWGGLKNVFKGDNSTSKQEREAHAELKKILTPDQLFWMGQSVLNAHYTSPKVVGSMYRVLRHFGIEGGRFLEPTVGTGNFIGLMPPDMAAGAKWFASEIDPITSLIAKNLYPDAQILPATGFQDAEFAYGRMDVAIGNPPFGDERITDTNKKRADISGFKIHNYVISKSAMHLRPGGIMAFVVTSRFLDTANAEAREYLAQNFKFIGAFRLPNDAFAENAGTEVTTDIIFLQRMRGDQRDGVTADDMPWLDTKGRMLNEDGETVTLNRYFAENPGMMLGKPTMQGTMYGSRTEKGEFTLQPRPGLDFAAEIDKIIEGDWAPLKGIGKRRAADADVAAAAIEINREDVPIGGYFHEGDRVVQRIDDDADGNVQFRELTPETPWTEKQTLGATRVARIKGMLKLRALAYDLMADERADAPAARLDAKRAELNRAYDAFVDEYGFLNDNANKSLMNDDPRIEFGLESDYTKAITPAAAKRLGQKTAPASAKKSSLLQERVFFPKQEVESADSPADGYAISLSEKGRLDLDYIAELTDRSVDDVIAELSTGDAPLIFKDPALSRWVQEDEYLSGNVKEKLKIARGAGLDANVRALEAVQPADVAAANIHAEFGATWIRPTVYEDFLKLLGYQSARVAVMPKSGAVEAADVGNLGASLFRADIENPDYSIAAVFSAAANRRQLVAYDGHGDDRVMNQERTENLGRIRNKLIAIWNDWIKSDPERAALLERDYNELMNTTVERKYDGVTHLRTVGANPAIELRNSQKDSSWRMIQSAITLLDHVVGAGKTIALSTGIMERKRLGLSQKPMVMVPNHLVGQWARDWMLLYPGANILAATEKDFQKANRRRLFARIATGKFDAIIVGHSSFGFIPVSREAEMEFIRGEVDHLNAALVEAESAEGGGKKGGKGDSRRVRGIKNRIAKRMEKIRELQDKPRDNVVTFEDMGIDYLAVDELHEFKNLEYATTLSNVAGMGSPEGSKKAFDLYMKMRLLQEAGGGIAGATGTPLSNSMVEMYSLLRYLNPGALAARNMEQFDAWVKAFASIEPRDEYTAAGKIKQRTVLATFNNLPELLQMYKQVADTVTMSDLKRIYAAQMREENARKGTKKREEFPVPKVAGGGRRLDIGAPTDEQVEFMDYLIARADILDKKKGKEKQAYAKIDNALWLMNDARKMSLDVRIIDPTVPDNPTNKVNRAAERIKGIYRKWDADLGTQLVFCDLSTPAKNAAKDAAAFIKTALKALGFESDAAIVAAIEGKDYVGKWAFLEMRAEMMLDAGTLDDAKRERIEAFLEKVGDDERSALVVADTGFSVYDALKAKLVELGIREREIAFIHDANTADQKKELFDLVNAGKVRVLIGSSAKMGAGTNAQKRLVALHHMDAPWRPSDIEQREGRIIRQGNMLYDRDPDGFEVEIVAYSTERTFDAQMWGVLARKAAFLEQFRSGLRSIKEEGSDAASYAEFMAEATGDQIFRDKLHLERELADIEAEDRSAKMKRTSAEQLVGSADEKVARLERELERAKRLADADLSSVTFDGKTYRNDLAEVVDAEMALYREELAEFAKVEDAYKIARKAWEDAAGTDRGRAPAKPKAPEVPDLNSERIEGKSEWAQLINELTKQMEMLPAGFNENYELVAANGVSIEIAASRRGDSTERSVFIAGQWLGSSAARGPFIASRLMPNRIMGELRGHPDRFERDLRALKTNIEQAQVTLDRVKPVDPQRIADLKARYEAVKKAVDEASARMAEERAQRANRFIAKDRKRFTGAAAASEVAAGRAVSVEEAAVDDLVLAESMRFRRSGAGVRFEPGAKDVTLPGLDGFTFFVVKESPGKTWFVIETTTGLSVGRGDTRKGAIEAATATAERIGAERFGEAVAKGVPITDDEKRSAIEKASPSVLRRAAADLEPIGLDVAAEVLARVRPTAEKVWNVDLRLVETFAALPQEVQDEVAKDYGAGERPQGVLSQGVVYLVADRHGSASELEATILHEVKGHVAARRFYGAEITQALNKLFVQIGGARGLQRIADERGMSKALAGYAEALAQSTHSDDVRVQIMMEEVLSHIAEAPRFMDRVKAIVGLLRDLLRRSGLVELAEFGETDLLHILKRAERALGRPGPDGGPSALRNGAEDNEIKDSLQAWNSKAVADAAPEIERARAKRELTDALKSATMTGDEKHKLAYNWWARAQHYAPSSGRLNVDSSASPVSIAMEKHSPEAVAQRLAARILASDGDYRAAGLVFSVWHDARYPGVQVYTENGGDVGYIDGTSEDAVRDDLVGMFADDGELLAAVRRHLRDEEGTDPDDSGPGRGGKAPTVLKRGDAMADLPPGWTLREESIRGFDGRDVTGYRAFDPQGRPATSFPYEDRQRSIDAAWELAGGARTAPQRTAPVREAVAAPAAGNGLRRATKEQAEAAGYVRAWRGVSKAEPLNDTDTIWLTTNRDVADAYAKEGFGMGDPAVAEIWYDPKSVPVHDVRKLTGADLEVMGTDDYGNPQALGIYRNSDDSPLGSSYPHTAIHAPRSSVLLVDDGGARFPASRMESRKGAEQRDATGLTAEAFRAALVDRFGEDGVASLEAQGLLNVLEYDPDDLVARAHMNENNPAWYNPNIGEAFFVPEFIESAEEAVALVLHEVGEHHGLAAMLGTRGWRTLKERVAELAGSHKDEVGAAWAGVLDNYPEFAGKGYDTDHAAAIGDDRFMHEVIAMLGEAAAGRKSSLWRDLLAAVNRFLLKRGIGRQINKNELADLVAGSLARVMGGKVRKGGAAGARMDSRRFDPDRRRSTDNWIDTPSLLVPEAVRAAPGRAVHAAADALPKKVGDYLRYLFDGTTSKTFNWYHKTVGSQFHKAKIDPQHYGRVFKLAQQFIDDVSRFGTEASDMAPDLLPKMDTTAGAVREAKNYRRDKEDAKAIASPIFEGTLYSENGEVVGKVWSDAELREHFRLNDRQIALYRQFRAAVDHSLETLAVAEMTKVARAYAEPKQPGDLVLIPPAAPLGMNELAKHYAEQFNDELRGAIKALSDLYGRIQSSNAQLLENAGVLGKSRTEFHEAMLKKEAEDKAAVEALKTKIDELGRLKRAFLGKASTIRKLQIEGYAPLMRFGKFTVDVVQMRDALDDDGQPIIDSETGEVKQREHRPFFGMFESEREAQEAAAIMREEYPDAEVTTGVGSQDGYQLFGSVSLDSLEMLARLAGQEEDAFVQKFYKEAVAQRSALKRLIHRQGIAGYSQDVTRSLAAFLMSNARATASAYHFGDLMKAAADIPKHKGDVKDEAVRLINYIRDPNEEAGALRGLLFMHFLGGSIAAAAVNLTQTVMTTAPFLHQFGVGPRELGRAALLAGKRMRGKDLDGVPASLRKALERAEQEGVVAPHNIHALMGQSGSQSFMNHRIYRLFTHLWGSFFGMAEQYNRETAFIAAFGAAEKMGRTGLQEAYARAVDVAKSRGLPAPDRAVFADPFAFAKNAVQETQFVLSKAARPNWARGAVGATLFTFRQFMVNYLELFKRLPNKERALMMGTLIVLAGVGGLPGADDLDDIIDTMGQSLGYNTNARRWKESAASAIFGEAGGEFVLDGVSAFIPLELGSRLGLGNVLPATGLFKPSNAGRRDMQAMEMLGAAGGYYKQLMEAADYFQRGRYAQALTNAALPKAFKDLAKGLEMADTGVYDDTRGRRVVDVSGLDAFIKATGFQPRRVSRVQDMKGIQMQDVALFKAVKANVAELLAQAIYERDAEKRQRALGLLADWNRKNPEHRMDRPAAPGLARRVQAMRMSAPERMRKTTPKELRETSMVE